MCRGCFGGAANAAALLRNAYERTNNSDRHRHPYSVTLPAALKRLFLTLRYIISENYMETCTSCGDNCSSLQQFLLKLHAGAVKTTLVCRGLNTGLAELIIYHYNRRRARSAVLNLLTLARHCRVVLIASVLVRVVHVALCARESSDARARNRFIRA